MQNNVLLEHKVCDEYLLWIVLGDVINRRWRVSELSNESQVEEEAYEEAEEEAEEDEVQVQVDSNPPGRDIQPSQHWLSTFHQLQQWQMTFLQDICLVV